jgi:hypothetical protein
LKWLSLTDFLDRYIFDRTIYLLAGIEVLLISLLVESLVSARQEIFRPPDPVDCVANLAAIDNSKRDKKA